MKSILILMLCCLILTGCAVLPSGNLPATDGQTQPSSEVSIPTSEATVPTSQTLSHQFLLYLPNDNADGFHTKDASLPELDGQAVFDLLIAEGVLNSDIRVNSLTAEGSHLKLDVNAAFLSQLMTYGTSGEYMMMGSVVNTLLNAYEARTLSITADGQIMESGHVIYDMDLTFHE